MEFKNYKLLLLLVFSTCLLVVASDIIVVEHGAKGDGKTDDSNAFMSAWKAACANTRSSTIVVPQGKTFLLSPIYFEGPCISSVNFRVDGKIIAPGQMWSLEKNQYWIMFMSVNHLTVFGKGEFDGNGQVWWPCRESKKCSDAAYAVGFVNCINLVLSGLNFVNSPMKHVAFYNTFNTFITGLKISAPGDSPNTDGIYIAKSQNVQVTSSTIGTGDDCIAIGDGSRNINISHINCGPGHGISIGSLGRDGDEVSVSQIHVSSCNLYGTTNGARIKTWQGGRGVAKEISFENINFDSVANPIIIDQYYCNGAHNCGVKKSAVRVSDVRYSGLKGTTTSDFAISLNCSQTVPCAGITMQDVDIRPSGRASADAFCRNANGQEAGVVVPAVPCLNG